MPNHVTNKVPFDSARAAEVFAACCPEGRLDFETLVPSPPHMYRGGLGSEDEKDFPCNWMSWCTTNWGTKWNAYDCTTGTDGERAFIQFDSAWSVPRPVIYALGKRFGLAMELRYFDEGHNFWGVEFYGVDQRDGGVYRRDSRRSKSSREEDKAWLCKELKGYDPESREVA